MKFLATEQKSDGDYGVEFDADNWRAAEQRCAAEGWVLDGELKAVVLANQTTPAEMQALVDRRNAGVYDA